MKRQERIQKAETSKVETADRRDTANNITTMENIVKIEMRRVVMTPKGRKFPPRPPATFDLALVEKQTMDELLKVLTERARENFPGLKNKETSILFEGDNGELLPCESQADIKNVIKKWNGGQIKLYAQSSCAGDGKNHKRFAQIQCSGCMTSFTGMQLKCLECPDTNFCIECGDLSTHKHHVMLRCDKPWFIEHALPKFETHISKMCEAIHNKEPGEAVAILLPDDIRQFVKNAHKQAQHSHDGNASKRKIQERHGGCHKRMAGDTKFPDVTCKNCDVVINGMRITCLECEDYHLCATCDEKDIHADHVMVKGDHPRFFNMALPMFSSILPNLCSEMRQQEGSARRLKPCQVRQFWQREKRGPGETGPACMEVDETSTEPTEFKCNVCKTSHSGMRLKCLQCADFMLCMDCDEKGFHKDHVMVKSDKPRFFSHALKHFAEVIPQIVEEQQKNAQPPLPRLKQQQVRRFWIQSRGKQQLETIRQFWREFLQQLTEDQSTPGPDWEMVSPSGTSSEDDANTVDELSHDKRDPLPDFDIDPELNKQQKREWMHHCLQLWRQETQKQNAVLKPGQAFRVWRRYMRGCWTSWLHDQRVKPDAVGKSHNKQGRRKSWIRGCWRIWLDEVTKCGKSEENKCVFPGFHRIMRQCWKVLPSDVQQCRAVAITPTADIQPEDVQLCRVSASTSNAEIEIDPERARQVLKKCWINGARQIWWRQANMPDEMQSRSHDRSNKDELRREILEAMAEKKKWKCYMSQIWQLWRQLSRQTGLSGKDGKTTDDTVEDEYVATGAKKRNAKQQWLDDCWPTWNQAMSNVGDNREPEGKKCPDRPFEGWRSLVMKSWKSMEDKLTAEESSEAAPAERAQRMREAWMKELRGEMQKMKIESDDRELGDDLAAQPQREEKLDEAAHQKWRQQLRRSLVQQYWQLLRGDGTSPYTHSPPGGRRHGQCARWQKRHQVDSPNTFNPEGPDEGFQSRRRLRLTLSAKK